MKTSVIIHGHFYQPPRENPYTGLYPNQSSAKPYENWNEAIYETCYKPNTASRYLSENGKIKYVFNNYESISSNFGQTLLDWADEMHPTFIKKLQEADQASIERFGHSSILSQVFNHTILPLDSDSTKRIQIHWAIEAYKARFSHKPEGMWLSECAIDDKTVDILSENGISFVILAPWQGIAIDGVPRNGKSMPSDRPFILQGPKGGRISAFFYDGEFASGVSFGHMLRDADAMFKRLGEMRKERKNPPLIHWATDGEVYGHHEPFGDMGLAAFIKKVNDSSVFEIENYGSYLEKHPATEVATLNMGDDHKGSSWSCIHGTGRWERDCGCHTGGPDTWNQKWRGPLRKALQNMEEKVRAIFDREVKRIFGSSRTYESLIMDYSAVLSHQETIEQFIDKLELNDKDSTIIASLLEAFKNTMFSYTSCGFFFNDLSGIEPRQNITYAMCAAAIIESMFDDKVTKSLLEDLSLAKSNIPSEGTGADIAKKDMPKSPNYAIACSYFALNRLFASQYNHLSNWGIFRLIEISDTKARIQNTRTLVIYDLDYEVSFKANGGITFSIRNTATSKAMKVNLAQLSEKTLSSIMNWVEDNLMESVSEKFIDSLSQNIGLYLMLSSTNRNLEKDSVFVENSGACLKSIKALILGQKDMDNEKRMLRIRQLSHFIMIKGRNQDIEEIKQCYSRYFEIKAHEFFHTLDEEKCMQALQMLKCAREMGIEPDITSLQNTIYTHLQGDLDEKLKKSLIDELNFSY